MKTQNNNQETSKSQVSKSTLGASAVLFGAVLISLSVNAQDFWKELSNSATYGKMAMVMDGQLGETENTDAAFEAINAEVALQLTSPIESEETMEIESWMVVEEFFSSNEALESVETSMEVESWMIEEANFTSTVNFNAVEAEESLHIEVWMVAEEFFNSPEVLKNTEPSLVVESWMITDEYFNSPEVLANEEALQVESWMLEAANFSDQPAYEHYAAK